MVVIYVIYKAMYQPLILRLVRYVNKKWFREETTEAPLQRKGREKSQSFFFLVIYRGSKEGFQKDFTGVNRNFIRFDRIFLPSIQAQYMQNTGGHLKGDDEKTHGILGVHDFQTDQRVVLQSYQRDPKGGLVPSFQACSDLVQTSNMAMVQHEFFLTNFWSFDILHVPPKNKFFFGPFQSNSPKQLKASGCFSVSPRCKVEPVDVATSRLAPEEGEEEELLEDDAVVEPSEDQPAAEAATASLPLTLTSSLPLTLASLSETAELLLKQGGGGWVDGDGEL